MTTVADATADRFDDVAAVFGGKGDQSRCWCQWFRQPNAAWNASNARARRAALQDQTASGVPPGVIAYDDAGEPVGWCGLAPRADYPRLARSPVTKGPPDEDGLWAITCFVVRPGARRQGISGSLLDAAVDLARRHAATTLEAYPIDVSVRTPTSSALYHGALSMFTRAGFTEVARPKPDRPTVRRTL